MELSQLLTKDILFVFPEESNGKVETIFISPGQRLKDKYGKGYIPVVHADEQGNLILDHDEDLIFSREYVS